MGFVFLHNKLIFYNTLNTNKMAELFKNAVYAGIGLVETVTEEVEKNLKEFQEKGKHSNNEARKLMEEFFEKSASKKDEFEDKLNNVVEKFGYTRKDELEALRRRVEELEEKLAEKTAKKATVEA
jgi:polyhydroxyalkanoate synthesis regulator phasin